MADDRQKCYAFPEQQENKTLKQKILPGNSSKIQVAMRKKKQPDISVCCKSDRIYVPISLQVLVQSISGYFQENRVRFCAFWNQGHGQDNMLLHHFTLKESMSGLINEGRENDILVFWPEIE